ncbi:hypothetical protein EDD15DRAFT_2202497 [Pisolithus albus]|nr:hypothetical protein EDD15DRAFT_2202497 [Pisolithus albus]
MLQRLQQKSGPILPLWHAAIMWEGPCGLPRVTWKGPGDMPYMASQHVDGPLGPYGLPRVTWKGLGDMPYMAHNLWTGPWLPRVTWKGPYRLPARVTRHIWHYNTCTGRWVVQETSLQHVEVPVRLTADDMKGAADDMDWAFGLPRVTYPTRQPMYGWGFGSMWLTSDDMEGSPSHAIHGNGLRCNISNSGPTSGNIKQTRAAYMAGDVGGSLAVKKVVECRVPER